MGIKKTAAFILIVIGFASTSKANTIDPTLISLMGEYKLGLNDRVKPCKFEWLGLVEQYGVALALNRTDVTEPNAVENPGDIGVELLQYFDGARKWVSLYSDRPQFPAVGGEAKKIPNTLHTKSMTNYTTWQKGANDARLTHVTQVDALIGDSFTQMWEIKFDKTRRQFVYSSYINDSGATQHLRLNERCTFKRAQRPSRGH